MIQGIINLDKPTGPTSHDMVAMVRRSLGVKQVGHAGTLDPLATGVLVMGVGPATRLMAFPGSQPKEYVARLRLGLTTDSEDITGATVAETSSASVCLAALETAAARFTGTILQTPPMVSAIRKDGRRLYELAREGKTVERVPREVKIYSLEVSDFVPGEQAEATLTVRCSGGVYVRTLCADIGDALGCGGCMAALRRTAVGPFRIENSVTPVEIAEQGARVLLPMAYAVAHLPHVALDAEQIARVIHGNWFEIEEGKLEGAEGKTVEAQAALLDARGALVAIANTLEVGVGRKRIAPYLVLQGSVEGK